MNIFTKEELLTLEKYQQINVAFLHSKMGLAYNSAVQSYIYSCKEIVTTDIEIRSHMVQIINETFSSEAMRENARKVIQPILKELADVCYATEDRLYQNEL